MKGWTKLSVIVCIMSGFVGFAQGSYELKLIVKYALTADSTDSLVRFRELEPQLYRTGLQEMVKDSGITNDSGYAVFNFDQWGDGSPIDSASLARIDITFPNTERVIEFGEQLMFQPMLLASVPFTGHSPEVISAVLPWSVHKHTFTIGDWSTGLYYAFAVLTDAHIAQGKTKKWNPGDGEYYQDFEDQGFLGEDRNLENFAPIENLRALVQHINQQYNGGLPLKFVACLGDLTHTAERAEFQRVRRLLGDLVGAVPYIPLMGNHDTWPYIGAANPYEGSLWKEQYDYDRTQMRVGQEFYLQNRTWFDRLATFYLPAWAVGQYFDNYTFTTGYDWKSYYPHYRFDLQNYRFIATDFTSRKKNGWVIRWAGTKYQGEAYNSSQRYTLDWVRNSGSSCRKTIIFDHIPYILHEDDCFTSRTELEELANYGNLKYLKPKARMIGGHLHDYGMEWSGGYHIDDTVALVYRIDAAVEGEVCYFIVYDSAIVDITSPPPFQTQASTVDFTSAFRYVGEQNRPYSHLWDFGDHGIGYGPTTKHTYHVVDNYDTVYKVTLSALTCGGRNFVDARPVAVQATAYNLRTEYVLDYKVKLRWEFDNRLLLSKYQVLRWDQLIGEPDRDQKWFEDGQDIVRGTTYRYKVKAIHCAGRPCLAWATIDVIVPMVSAPTNLHRVVKDNLNTIRLEWDLDSHHATQCLIARQVDDEVPNEEFATVPASQKYLETEVDLGHTYQYWVVAKDGQGNNSAPSNKYTLDVGLVGTSSDAVTTAFNNGRKIVVGADGVIHAGNSTINGVSYPWYNVCYGNSSDGGNTWSAPLGMCFPRYNLENKYPWVTGDTSYPAVALDHNNVPHVVWGIYEAKISPAKEYHLLEYWHAYKVNGQWTRALIKLFEWSLNIPKPWNFVSPPSLVLTRDSIYVAVNIPCENNLRSWRTYVMSLTLYGTGSTNCRVLSDFAMTEPSAGLPTAVYDRGGRIVVFYGGSKTSHAKSVYAKYLDFYRSPPAWRIVDQGPWEGKMHSACGGNNEVVLIVKVDDQWSEYYKLQWRGDGLVPGYRTIPWWPLVRGDYQWPVIVENKCLVYDQPRQSEAQQRDVFIMPRFGEEWGPPRNVTQTPLIDETYPHATLSPSGQEIYLLYNKKAGTGCSKAIFNKVNVNAWPVPLTAKSNARKILRDYNGNLHQVRFDNYPPWDTMPLGIFYSISTDIGQSWSTKHIGEGIFPALAKNEDGEKKVIAWLDETEKCILYSFKDSSSFFWSPPCTVVTASPLVNSEVYSAPSISFCFDTVHIGHKARTEVMPGTYQDNVRYLRFPYNNPQDQYSEVVDSWTPDSLSFPENPRTRAPSIATDYNGLPYMCWARPSDQYQCSDIYYGTKMGSEWIISNISSSTDSSTCPSIECYGGNISVVWSEKVNDNYAIIRYLTYPGGEGFRVDTVTVTANVAKYPTISKEYILWEQETETNPQIVGRRWDAMGQGWSTLQYLSSTENPSLYPHSEVWMDFFNLNTFSFWTEVAGETLRLQQDFRQEPLWWGFAGYPFPYYYLELGDSTPFTLRRTGGIIIDSVKCDYAKDSLIYFLPHTDTTAKYRVTIELYSRQAKAASGENDALQVEDPALAGLDIQKGESWVRLRVDNRIQTNVKLKPGINRFTFWVPQTIIAKTARLILKKLSGANVYCHRIIWEQYEKPKERALAGGGGVQEDESGKIPLRFYLKAARPNPFNRRTTVDYGLARNCRVRVRVYDVTGRVVATLKNKVEAAGIYSLRWDAGNTANGVYFVELEAGKYLNRKKVVLVR